MLEREPMEPMELIDRGDLRRMRARDTLAGFLIGMAGGLALCALLSLRGWFV